MPAPIPSVLAHFWEATRATCLNRAREQQRQEAGGGGGGNLLQGRRRAAEQQQTTGLGRCVPRQVPMGPLSAPRGGWGGLGSAWWGFSLSWWGWCESVMGHWKPQERRRRKGRIPPLRVEIHVIANARNVPLKHSQRNQTSATCCPSRSWGFTAWSCFGPGTGHRGVLWEVWITGVSARACTEEPSVRWPLQVPQALRFQMTL